MREFLFEHVFEHGAEVGAVADGQIALVGPRTRGHVDPGLKPQRIPTLVAQDAVNHGQVVFHDVGKSRS